jgi:hypothetical protein
MWDASLTDDLITRERISRYLIVVAASDEALCRYLEARFEADAHTRVILDRRRRGGTPDGFTGVERRLSPAPQISSLGVAVIRLTGDLPAEETIVLEQAGERTPVTMEGTEDRQRVDRWLEESQYVIGRMIPAYLDDRERVRARLETVEQDNERLRSELADARREIAELCGHVDFHRGERARMAENFHTIMEHLTALQGPVNDIQSRLQISQPMIAEARV